MTLMEKLKSVACQTTLDDGYYGLSPEDALTVFSEWLAGEAPEMLRKAACGWSTDVGPNKKPYWVHLSAALAEAQHND